MTKLICKNCGSKIIDAFSNYQNYCKECWKNNKTQLNSKKEVKMDKTQKKDANIDAVEGKSKKSKTELKEEHATAVISLLKERAVDQELATKVLSCAYNKAKNTY